jgi:hypothetical protein
MASMSYCRHENTAAEMGQVVDMWEEFDFDGANEYEKRGREQVIALAAEILELAREGGKYVE